MDYSRTNNMVKISLEINYAQIKILMSSNFVNFVAKKNFVYKNCQKNNVSEFVEKNCGCRYKKKPYCACAYRKSYKFEIFSKCVF